MKGGREGRLKVGIEGMRERENWTMSKCEVSLVPYCMKSNVFSYPILIKFTFSCNTMTIEDQSSFESTFTETRYNTFSLLHRELQTGINPP